MGLMDKVKALQSRFGALSNPKKAVIAFFVIVIVIVLSLWVGGVSSSDSMTIAFKPATNTKVSVDVIRGDEVYSVIAPSNPGVFPSFPVKSGDFIHIKNLGNKETIMGRATLSSTGKSLRSSMYLFNPADPDTNAFLAKTPPDTARSNKISKEGKLTWRGNYGIRIP